MKFYGKMFLSVFLAVVFVFSCVSVAFASDKCDCGYSPIIYVIGRTTIYDDKDHPTKALVDGVNADKLTGKVKDCLPYAAEAALLGKWDAYYEKLDELVAEYAGNYAPDCNGDVTDNSGPVYTWSEEKISKNHKYADIYTYHFAYDSRLSPMVIADDLHDYIEAVKRVTGHDKVSIVCRCVGVNYAFAYLYKYQKETNYNGIDSLVIYDSALYGCESLEAAFSGTVHFDAESGDCYLNNLDISLGDDTVNAFLKQTLQMLHETYGIELTASFLNLFYGKLQREYIPGALKKLLGLAPGYWSMIYRNYDEAKEYLLGDEPEKYEKLIAKIDDFHYNVQNNAEDMILSMKENGVDVNIICKYGFQNIPLNEDSFLVSDDTIGVDRQSLGATVAQYNKTLGSSYIAKCTLHGKADYISPDGQIDASTGILPDNTWYIKNYHHNPFYNEMNPMLFALCYQDGIQVGSDDRFYRFSIFTFGSLPIEMTEENCNTNGVELTDGDEGQTIKNPITVFIKFLAYLRVLFDFLRTLRKN